MLSAERPVFRQHAPVDAQDEPPVSPTGGAKDFNGIIIDFIARWKGNLLKTAGAHSNAKALSKLASVDVTTCRAKELVRAVQEGSGFTIDIDLLHKEMLEHSMMKLLTRQGKARGDKNWSSKASFKAYALDAVKLMQTSAEWSAELQHWREIRKVMGMLRAPEQESMLDRQVRMNAFWGQYHRGIRKGERDEEFSDATAVVPAIKDKCTAAKAAGGGGGMMISPAGGPGAIAIGKLASPASSPKARDLRSSPKTPVAPMVEVFDSEEAPDYEPQSPVGILGKSYSCAGGQQHRNIGMNDMSWKVRSARTNPSASSLLSRSLASFTATTGLERSCNYNGLTLGQAGSTMTFGKDEDGRFGSPLQLSAPAVSKIGTKKGWRTPFVKTLNPMLAPLSSQPQQKLQPQAPAMTLRSSSVPDFRSKGKSSGSLLQSLAAASTSQLPPLQTPFQMPHSKVPRNKPVVQPIQSPNPSQTPLKKYLLTCDKAGLRPVTIPTITGHSTKFDVSGRSLSDADLHAVTATISGLALEEIDISENLLLSDKAIVNFLDVLFGPPMAKSLRRLNLSRCLRIGQDLQRCICGNTFLVDDDECRNCGSKRPAEALGSVVRLLGDAKGVIQLQHLDLSGIQMGMKVHLPLCRAIKNHGYLTTVSLANTRLGSSASAKQCVGEVLGSDSITTLDLSWNCFTVEVLQHVGEKVLDMKTLTSLRLSNCVRANCDAAHATKRQSQANVSPIVFFVEHLVRAQQLTNLDISLNRMDFRAALVVEDALATNKRLRHLDISSNPLGVFGMRSLLRLLSYKQSGLAFFACDDCFTGAVSDDDTGHYQVFSSVNPGGRYKMELHRPYHRSLLRMLYKTCERFGLGCDVAFSDLQWTGNGTWQHASKDASGIWVVPDAGTLEVTFSIDKAMEKALSDIPEWDFRRVLEAYNTTMRLEPEKEKVIPLLAQWRSIDDKTLEQETMLDALSHDFQFSFPMVKEFCRSRSMIDKVVSTLLPTIDGGGKLSRYLSLTLVPSVGKLVAVVKRTECFLNFQADNPSGHYYLELANCADACVAQSCLLLDRWEYSIAKRKGLTDVSQRGDLSVFRNVFYQHRPLTQDIAKWNMPEQDTLSFDYVTRKRPSDNEMTLEDSTFQQLLGELKSLHCSAHAQVEALKTIAPTIYITALQLRQLLGSFRNQAASLGSAVSARVEVCVAYQFRVVDIQNEKMFRVRIETPEDRLKLRQRLGYCTSFPFLQPEQSTFSFDFAENDQRLAASVLISMALKESFANLTDAKFVNPDGTVDVLQLGVPRTWESVDKMPAGGVLTVTYLCAPGDRSFALRKGNLEKFGYWAPSAELQDEDVTWWMDLVDVHPDVLAYVCFIRRKFKTTAEAFEFRHEEGGSGQIKMSDWEEAWPKMECTKLKGGGKDGASEMDRAKNLFKQLDFSGEGEISDRAFAVLDLMWNEIELSIKEFVQFCERTFGKKLANAWSALDRGNHGSIQVDEWSSALTKVGYFGPAKPIFQYLEDETDTISLKEFETLSKFKT